MNSIVVYVPLSHLENVKSAMFAAGAGRIGNYECCSWTVLGEGQFKALHGAAPFLGKVGEIEKVSEYRVEMVCEKSLTTNAIAAMRTAHPYETPAFLVLESTIE